MRPTAVYLASFWLAIFVACNPSLLSAEDGDSPVLTEDDFLADILARDDVLRSLSRQLGERRADLLAVETLNDPVLSWNREDVEGPGLETEASLSWKPPRPDRRRLERDAARSRVESAEAGRTASLLELRSELRAVYARWALARARAGVLADEAGILRELVRRTRERHDAGEASGWELRRLRLAASEVTSRLETQRAEARRAEAEARAWLGAGTGDLRPRVPELPVLGQTGDVDDHPRLREMTQELRAAELAERAAAKLVDMPALSVGWKREESDRVDLEGPVLGVSWPVPLFERRRAERARAGSRREALEARVDLLRRRLTQERDAARDTYGDLREATLEIRRRADDARPAVEAALRAFRLGEADLTDLLETARSARTARLSALDLHHEALAAHRHWELLGSSASSSHPTKDDTHISATQEPSP